MVEIGAEGLCGSPPMRMVRHLGQTIVMMMHDPVAASDSDRVVFLADGRIIEDMTEPTPQSVIERMRLFEG